MSRNASTRVSSPASAEGVRAAREIGDVGPEELGVLFDPPRGLHEELAHAPVHMALGAFLIQFEEIQRDHRDAA